MQQMDTFFIGHGPPTLFVDESMPAKHFLTAWKKKALADTPTAILVISGHWNTADPTVNVVHSNDTIYDYDGFDFPKAMYELKYQAPGAPHLAKRVKELLTGAGFKNVREDKNRGLDHGAWVPLMLMYPQADIPVCQLSVQPDLDGTHHYNMGKALGPLSEEGVLIFGSGNTTHNLGEIDLGNSGVVPWALEFDTWIKEALVNGRHDDIKDYDKKAPYAKMAHPWPDHLYPLHVALGAAGEGAKAELIHHNWQAGTVSFASYRFKSTK